MNWEDLADELETIGLTLDRVHRLEEYGRILAAMTPGEEGYAEVLTCSADDLTTEGRFEAARSAYQGAIDDGGRTVLSPHGGLLDVALKAGDDARADELLTHLMGMSRADDLKLSDYHWIAEALEEAGRLKQALRWFTIPLRDIQPGDVDFLPIGCLNGRFRVRRALDLPVDAYDEAREVWHELNAGQPS